MTPLTPPSGDRRAHRLAVERSSYTADIATTHTAVLAARDAAVKVCPLALDRIDWAPSYLATGLPGIRTDTCTPLPPRASRQQAWCTRRCLPGTPVASSSGALLVAVVYQRPRHGP
jgi:hypothetical protein